MIVNIKLYIRGQSRDFDSGESGFYMERLNRGSEVRAMRNKSQDGIGRDGSEVQVRGTNLGIIFRTQRIHRHVLSCPAEARGVPLTLQNWIGHHLLPQARPTSIHPFPGLELLQGFLGSPHWLLLGDQTVSLAHRFQVSPVRLHITILPVPVGYGYPGYVFWFPSLFSGAGCTRMEKQWAYEEPRLSSITALPPAA